MDNSAVEKECIRKMNLLYFLEDHTVQINEPLVENSGMMQGTFLRRQRVLKDSVNTNFLTFQELLVGEEVVIYNWSFRVTSCNNITRNWYRI